MAKSKKTSTDRHTAARRAVQLPAEWADLAEKCADGKPMPLAWWLLQAIKDKAEKEGVEEFPQFPWEKK